MTDIEPRPLPAETIEALVPPLPGFPFFAHAGHFEFESEVSEYSAVNAWWLADASFLVYGSPDFIEREFANSPLSNQGFHIGWLGTREDNRGMYLSSDTSLICCFRGTRLQTWSLYDLAEIVLIDEDDFWTDSQFLPEVFRAGGHVHRGFAQAYREIGDRLDAVVAARKPSQKLWLTGHSLGGALATLAAAHIGSDLIQGIYTYGAPRVGDRRFIGLLPGHSHIRFVHRDDWVPTVPPELLGYVHGGESRFLPGSGQRRFWDDVASGANLLTAAVKSMARQVRIDMGKLPLKISGLTDHAPIYYATLLWNQLLES